MTGHANAANMLPTHSPETATGWLGLQKTKARNRSARSIPRRVDRDKGKPGEIQGRRATRLNCARAQHASRAAERTHSEEFDAELAKRQRCVSGISFSHRM